ncbi:hypothetical protein NW762_006178 [Fusarium torreyae]|uniref:Xylanolytic transcriptional activator regulatory domain-containing protein n=1 Tax=Fusarium torreyae TaxID=1237075 RepID=A0A9W8VHQ8_9HYPO|nr:hypothetical protein NW762_006178 [Fusarium torreyae]
MRCRSRNLTDNCTYRTHPFQKIRRPVADVATDLEDARQNVGDKQTEGSHSGLTSLGGHIAQPGPMPKRHRYPNPGYLGSSSYTALFGQLPSSIEIDLTGDNLGVAQGQGPIYEPVNEAYILHGADLIVQMSRFAQIPTCVRLVNAWVATQSNLVLASPFTAQCAGSAECLLSSVQEGTRSPAEMSRDLFIHSCRPLTAESSSTSQEFCEQFTGRSSRWETLCLFLTAVSRAAVALDVSQFPFESDQHRRDMRRLSMHYADRCLDICLSLECPNDLQLILQYENFILHTQVDGDHSFESWRKLGDVVSSLFALGYHQDIEGHGILPPFLRDLRRAAFTNCYSSDKDVSIFLGRPPRISRKFCNLNMLGLGSNEWSPDSVFNFIAESRWAAMCAILKEDILELSGAKDMDERSQMARSASSAEILSQKTFTDQSQRDTRESGISVVFPASKLSTTKLSEVPTTTSR